MLAAIKIYGERGFRNCSVKTVCNAAGLTERYFYESFSNGEDMLQQCFRLVTSELILTMRETAENAVGHPRMRVRAALLTYLVHRVIDSDWFFESMPAADQGGSVGCAPKLLQSRST